MLFFFCKYFLWFYTFPACVIHFLGNSNGVRNKRRSYSSSSPLTAEDVVPARYDVECIALANRKLIMTRNLLTSIDWI